MTVCPKCKYESGDDWRQCKGSCPMPMSPHYQPVPGLHENFAEEAAMNVTDEELRAVGFTSLARDYPRDDLALRMFAAFQGNITVDQLPPGMRYFPNEWTQQAWQRVADAAISALTHPPAKREAGENVDASILRERISRAIFDPGQTEGYKGERTLTDWQTDAVMRVLGHTPSAALEASHE